jgi:hypothetical protein
MTSTTSTLCTMYNICLLSITFLQINSMLGQHAAVILVTHRYSRWPVLGIYLKPCMSILHCSRLVHAPEGTLPAKPCCTEFETGCMLGIPTMPPCHNVLVLIQVEPPCKPLTSRSETHTTSRGHGGDGECHNALHTHVAACDGRTATPHADCLLPSRCRWRPRLCGGPTLQGSRCLKPCHNLVSDRQAQPTNSTAVPSKARTDHIKMDRMQLKPSARMPAATDPMRRTYCNSEWSPESAH